MGTGDEGTRGKSGIMGDLLKERGVQGVTIEGEWEMRERGEREGHRCV